MRRVRRYVRVNGDRCIPRGSHLRVRVLWAWAQLFRLRVPRGLALVLVARRDVRGNVMFRAV